jgi:hypothetical protein
LLRNPNLIRAGEVLYHIPTWQHYMRGKSDVPPPPPPPALTDEQKKKLARESIKGELGLKGDYGVKFLNEADKAAGLAAAALEVLSWFATALEAVATGAALIMVPYEMYGMIKGFCNVSDRDLRMYGMRASAYATTAWAFGDTPIPTSSPELRKAQQDQPKTAEQMKRLDEVWKTAADQAIANQERFALEQVDVKATPEQKKAGWQAGLRALGDGKRTELCKRLLEQLGDKCLTDCAPNIKDIWRHQQTTTLYPQ